MACEYKALHVAIIGCPQTTKHRPLILDWVPGACFLKVTVTFFMPERLFYVCHVCIQDLSLSNFEMIQ